jgi:hypothetical protein
MTSLLVILSPYFEACNISSELLLYPVKSQALVGDSELDKMDKLVGL